ncbi:MAG TPA: AMP-binding protein [Acidimicrobiales bacterium]|nr:AMP-binding protein [Acidimicrobiales bacterium]
MDEDPALKSVAQLLLARTDDPAPGLRFENEEWSWAEVVARSGARAAWLVDRRADELISRSAPSSPPPPFNFGMLLDNVPEYCFWLGGAALAGATVVGINPTRRGRELSRDIAHTNCQFVITDGEHRGWLADVDVETVDVETVTVTDAPAVDVGIDPRTLFVLLFTSGTTGAPKAVKCSQGRMVDIARKVESMLGVTSASVFYEAMPMFHGNALMTGWSSSLAAGACVALRRKFSASQFLDDIRRFGATHTNYVGKALTYVLATAEQPNDADNPLTVVFGNEAREADVERFGTRFGCRVIEGYGSTEGGTSINRTADTPPGSLGRGAPGTVVLDPETGAECPPGVIGEIANTESAARFEGYWNNAEAEHDRTRDGIYWTGDLGYTDDEGFFYFAGRNHDWLRVDGENFAAAPVERVLEQFPDIELAAVYAVPDPAAGDAVMTALELRPGAELDADALAVFLASHPDLGTKWMPRFIRIVAKLPMTQTNKVVKADLRDERWECADPVWWRPAREPAYRRLTGADRDAIAKEMAQHG